MQGAVESIVDGLFSALVTLGTVPIIKCPKVWQALSAMCELSFVLDFSAIYKFVKNHQQLHSSKLQLHAYYKEPGTFACVHLTCCHKRCFSTMCMSNACRVHLAGLCQYGSLYVAGSVAGRFQRQQE